ITQHRPHVVVRVRTPDASPARLARNQIWDLVTVRAGNLSTFRHHPPEVGNGPFLYSEWRKGAFPPCTATRQESWKVGLRGRVEGMARSCSIANALEVVGERWTLLALREVLLGNRRFDQIVQQTGASRDILAARLRKLVEVGLLERRQYELHP